MSPDEVQQVHIGALQFGQESPNHLLVGYARVQNILAPAFDIIATNQGSIDKIWTDVNLRLIGLFKQIMVEHGK